MNCKKYIIDDARITGKPMFAWIKLAKIHNYAKNKN